MRTLYVNGDEAESFAETEALDDAEGWRVQVEDPAISSGYDPECAECSETIYEDDAYPGGWRHQDDMADRPECDNCGLMVQWIDGAWHHHPAIPPDDLDPDCAGAEPGDEYHQARPTPGGWWNSASISYDPDDDAVTVTISVGDPRGAFAFTVRRMSEEASDPAMRGRLIMHTPYPGEGMPHEETHEIRPGTLLIGPALASQE